VINIHGFIIIIIIIVIIIINKVLIKVTLNKVIAGALYIVCEMDVDTDMTKQRASRLSGC